MTQHDKERIEKDADNEMAKHSVHPSFKSGYIAGATAENEHLRELHKWLNDDILTLKEQLKQERNKVIDHVLNLINKHQKLPDTDTSGFYALEKLKEELTAHGEH